MLKELRKNNTDYFIYDVSDDCFKKYGRILEKDVSEAIEFTNSYSSEQSYVSDVKELNGISCIRELSEEVYGGLETIAGIVQGENSLVNGMEYHQCSETIVAVTDIVLALGLRSDMHGNDYYINQSELFYIPKGIVVELYASTLHYTPICIYDKFKTICLLLKGTGDPIKRRGILKKKNKWFIAHPSNEDKILSGDYPGLRGPLIKINHL